MNVTKIETTFRTGLNKRPAGGFVTFDDGKTFSFGLSGRGDGYCVFSYRKVDDRRVLTRVYSPKRVAALNAAFDV